MPVICEGCGRPVPIPEGYRRNKIQCPCGVICPVPEAARQEADAPAARPRPAPAARTQAVEEEAERWLLDDAPPAAEPPREPPTFRDPEPKAPPAAAKPATPSKRFPCRRCGRLIARQRECPTCDGVPSEPAQEEPVWWPSVDESDEPAGADEDDSPYGVEGADEVRCPECSFMLPPGSVLCVRCGFHLRRRKKLAKTYQPIERAWETNYPLQTRLAFFAACEGLALALGLVGVFWGGADLFVFIGAFLVLTAMLAFLLGTYPHIHLSRDVRGRVRLTKMWRAGFFALKPETTDVRGFDGIVSGQHRDVTTMDFVMLLIMTVSGLIPGLIWYYLAFHKVTFHVSLTRDHGYPAYVVYSGWNEKQMKEIAYVLRDATGLLYDEG